MINIQELTELLPAHLMAQRWFGSRQHAEQVHVSSYEVIRKDWPRLLRAVAAVGDVRYQLLLGLRPAEQWGEADVGGAAAVGIVDSDEGPAFCYAALADRELAHALLRHVAPQVEAHDVRPIMAEQSNTSLVYDEQLILKVFRKLAGSNPDVEVTTALQREGFGRVAAPVAVWRVGTDDCAILQRFLAGGAEGWALALTSLRDYYATGGMPAEAGGDFAPEAARLGVLTAQLHRALADAFGAKPGSADGWASSLEHDLVPVTHPGLDPAAVRRVIDGMRKVSSAGVALRVHGDYHLGQVLRTDEGWFVVDFEGEPGRRSDQRRIVASPLRDVAGMLRSFDYAARVALSERGGDVEERADAWEQRNRSAFLDAYRAEVDGRHLVPEEPAEFDALLAAYEIDKAVYEVAYEQHHRPDWVGIPLAGAHRIIHRSS